MDEKLEKCSDSIKVSIVVPVYNVSAYIERCIQSVMAQTYTNIECIIIDDVTPDDSISKCESLIAKYNGPIKFVILHHEKNRGLSAARNTGTEAATGEYIYYLDSDDEVTEDCVEKLIEPALKDKSIEMVQGNIEKSPNIEGSYQYDLSIMGLPSNELIGNKEIRKWYFVPDFFRPRNSWNKLIRLDFVRQNHLDFREGLIHEDELWMFHFLKYVNHIFYVFDKTYLHYVTEGSIMTQKNRSYSHWSWSMILKEIFSNLTETDKKTEIKFYLRNYIFTHYDHFIQSENIDENEVYKVIMRALPKVDKLRLRCVIFIKRAFKGVRGTIRLTNLILNL